MNDWASRRKSIYLGFVVLILTIISFIFFWKFWYKTPTCFDGVRNGDEDGIDCGGSCSLVCSVDVLPLVVRSDPRIFEVLPGVWSVIVYVENQNTNLDASYTQYTFKFYDDDNNIIYERSGTTIIPKNKTSAIFEGSISPERGRIKRVTFELGKDIYWQKNESKDEIVITHSAILREETSPRIEARVKNNSIEDIENVELIISIFDGNDNTIAASRTFVEKINKNSYSDVFFTWPKPFELGTKICEKPTDLVLLIDRSGSMTSLGTNPPEPLTSVKIAAVSFIDELSTNDRVAVISFATNQKKPIELELTDDFSKVKDSINSILIEKGGVQYTNIAEALRAGFVELESARASEDHNKVLILLTDGIANYPKDPVGKSESDDIKYAEDLSIKEAMQIKNNGVSIYTIGLGQSINESFLKQIASKEDNYYFSPSTKDLSEIYKNISSSICKEKPVRIDITYKILVRK